MSCDEDCPRCVGAACNACVRDDPSLPIGAHCTHDTIERHMGMSALDIMSRKVTKEIPPLNAAAAITVELGEGTADQLADFLEAAAKIARTYGGVKLTAEKP